jgi:hypothetical protein
MGLADSRADGIVEILQCLALASRPREDVSVECDDVRTRAQRACGLRFRRGAIRHPLADIRQPQQGTGKSEIRFEIERLLELTHRIVEVPA